MIYGGDGDDILSGQAGDDTLRGEGGDDWLAGGTGKDVANGGTGKNKTSSGSENSSALRSAVAARLINWKDSFKSFGLHYSPFGGLNLGNSHRTTAASTTSLSTPAPAGATTSTRCQNYNPMRP